MSPAVRAAIWMLGAVVAFSSMAIAGRALTPEHSTFEIMFYRSLIGIVLVLVIGGALGRLGEVSTRHFGLHAIRNLSHFTGQNLWFFALGYIPLSQLFALEFTTPIWVLLLAALFLGEHLTRFRIAMALLGFVGVLIVARPGVAEVNIGTITAALAAIGFAGSIVTTKRLTRDVSTTCILFWLTVMQAVFGLITTAWDGQITFPSAQSRPWLVLVGCAGLAAHLCLTTALKFAPATVVVPLDFARLPVIAVIGFLFYSEPFDAFVFLGAAVIFLANYLNILRETRRTTVL